MSMKIKEIEVWNEPDSRGRTKFVSKACRAMSGDVFCVLKNSSKRFLIVEPSKINDSTNPYYSCKYSAMKIPRGAKVFAVGDMCVATPPSGLPETADERARCVLLAQCGNALYGVATVIVTARVGAKGVRTYQLGIDREVLSD